MGKNDLQRLVENSKEENERLKISLVFQRLHTFTKGLKMAE